MPISFLRILNYHSITLIWNEAIVFHDQVFVVMSFVSIVSAVTASLLLIVVTSLPHVAEVAAAFPPWWDQARVFDAAGRTGDIVGTGFLPSIVIIRGAPSDLASRLHQAGAVITLDARSFINCGASDLDDKR